ncbi:MAG TPA: isopentenyl transferase family protein [Spirochaetota bacterium]|nr:isopentenyl transferase family protein [Spirochaetota bacterium]HQF77009.1 isopentenyl transferase family protein [Spirochaetota bacterium]HQH31848.1 isopentenyl transferase family protein [Spirochaetota bacterium]HQJ05373.1 isopentenyl transferase family protein [Spirochaetota bacterium]HRU43194.1 isopentenyl transferase family protein [Spirochaetota bacterium]
MNPIAVAIMGPTGVGKTSLSLELARNDGEIISADSMQVYKYLDVGTAKPDAKDRDKVVHRLVDIITPDKRFSAADFKNLAESFIFEISKKKRFLF